MIHHRGGGIGHLQNVHSVDHEQNDTVQDSSAAEGDTTWRGESNTSVESDSESETDYDMGSGSERGDDSDDFSEDEESDGYATLWCKPWC